MENRCDNVVGAGSQRIMAGSYKAPVEKTDKDGNVFTDEETRYKFLIRFDLPEFTPELTEKLVNLGVHRAISVKAAGTFNKANEYGTVEDAEAFAAGFSTVEGWDKHFAKPERKERTATGVTPLIQASRDCLELGLMAKMGLDPATIAKDKLKEIRTSVREHQKDNTPQWQWALGKGQKELANRMKKAGDMPD